MAMRRKRGSTPAVSAEELAEAQRLLAANAGAVVVGGPVRCADCEAWGMVDHWDRSTGRFAYRCPSCRSSWTLCREAVIAAGRRPEPVADAPWVAPDGAVRVSWGAGPATSGRGAGRRSAGSPAR